MIQERRARVGLGWLLGTSALVVPWLVPTHAAPWTTFYAEWLMAATLLPVAAWTIVRSARWEFCAIAAGTAAMSLVPLLQAMFGLYTFPAESWLVAAYIVGVAMAMAVARAAEQVAPGQLIDALFDALVAAAAISSALALYQWLDLDVLGLMVWSPPSGTRPVANVGQPNNLSTLLVWGLVGLWRSHVRGRLGGAAAVCAAAFILVGVALTQSRTGWVAVAMCAALGLLARHKLAPGRRWLAVVGLFAWFCGLVLVLGAAGHSVLPASAMTIDQQVTVGKRPMIWALALQAIAGAPWFGYGWLQGVRADLELAPRFESLQTTVQYMHNVVLDLAVWQGVPLTLAVVGGCAVWSYQRRRLTTAAQLLLWLALAVLSVHAMLELPHAYAFFLLPAALIIGTLGAQDRASTAFSLPRWVAGGAFAALALILAVMFVDYRRIEDDGLTRSLREARIGRLDMPESPPVYFLVGLDEGLHRLRVKPSRDMSAAEIQRMRRTLDRYPSVTALLRYAQANVLAGDRAEATWAWQHLCAMHPASACEAAAIDWATAGIAFPELLHFAVPPVALRPSAPSSGTGTDSPR